MCHTLVALTMVLFSSFAAAQSSVLLLTVQSRLDPTNSNPDSHLYLAFAKNISRSRLYLPIAKLAGGYSGEGIFFPCLVEVNTQDSGAWKVVREVKLQSVSGDRDPSYVRLEPGADIEVCRALLPAQGGTHAMQARFVLLRDWNVDAPRWVRSKDFKIQ
jgi:hypothetical protein